MKNSIKRGIAIMCATVICCGLTEGISLKTADTDIVRAAETDLLTRNSHIDMNRR